MSKLDFSKLTPRQLASLDFKGDLCVASRIRAGVGSVLAQETLGAVEPPPPPPGGLKLKA